MAGKKNPVADGAAHGARECHAARLTNPTMPHPSGILEAEGAASTTPLDRPAIDHAAVEAHCRFNTKHIARRHDPFARYERRQYVFSGNGLKRIVTDIEKARDSQSRTRTLQWIDTATGVEGEGFISLAAHVWRVAPDEAAYRLARFFAMTVPGYRMDHFLPRNPGAPRGG